MAQVLLLGVALLCFLALGHCGDVDCNVTIERTELEDPSRVRLRCVVTGNATSMTWTRDGQLVPETTSQPAALYVEIPLKHAKGQFVCHVLCGKDLKQRASVSLDSLGKPDPGLAVTVVMAFSTSMAVLFVGLILVHVCCYCGKHYQRWMAAAQGSTGDEGAGGPPLVLTARPLIAPPLAASQA